MFSEMDSEKRRVPKALHHELSEYASLLRALRARDTLDLTKYLAQPSPFALDNVTNEDDDQDTPCPGPSDLSHPANSPSPSRSLRSQGKQKELSEPPEQIRRDHWTRWPLLLKDVLLPEWTLQDEVAVIVSQLVKSRQPLVFPVPNVSPDCHGMETAGGDEYEDEDDRLIHVMDMEVESDDPDPPFYVPYLTSIIAKYLATIFSILASHTPARPASMQNRIEPLNWRAVVDVVVSCGIPEFANPKIVENVIKRMEAIYGPSIIPLEDTKSTSFRAVERLRNKQAATQMLEKVMANARDNHFIPYSPQPDPSPVLDLMPVKKKNKVAVKEEEAFKPRTKKVRDGPSRKRGNPNKKRPRPKSPPMDHVLPVDAGLTGEGEASEPTRRSARTKKDVNYFPDPLFKI